MCFRGVELRLRRRVFFHRSSYIAERCWRAFLASKLSAFTSIVIMRGFHLRTFLADELCSVPSIRYITTPGAIAADGSEVNFIDSVSFEGNHAFNDDSVGRGKLKKLFPQYEQREPK